MSSTEPPTTTTSPRRNWRSRLRGRGAVITGIIAALVVAGVAAVAILWPDDDDHGRFGPGFDRAGWAGQMDERGGPWRDGGPGRWDDDDRGGDDRDDDRGDGDDEGRGPRGVGFGDDPVITGTVASVADGSLVVNVDGAGQRTLRTDGDTEVGGAGNNGLGDLQAGERVVVGVEGAGETATAESVWAPQASVTGTVTALTGDRATVTSVEGLAVTADVAALSQRPVVGDVVVLTGTAADASTITADGVRILPRAS